MAAEVKITMPAYEHQNLIALLKWNIGKIGDEELMAFLVKVQGFREPVSPAMEQSLIKMVADNVLNSIR